MNRRKFIKGTISAAVSLPYIVPSTVWGRSMINPSDKVVMGFIGVGWMGGVNLGGFLGHPQVKVVAVCDVDKKLAQQAKNSVDGRYGNTDCQIYHDFRELVARKDIDAVCVATPDHWHALTSIAALEAGKDVYCEKPITHSHAEGRAVCDAVKKYGSVWQTGSQQRSYNWFRLACELVRNGRIGKVKRVEVGLPGGHADFAGTRGQETIEEPPAELDYDFWLGPAPYQPYCVARVHKNWRWHFDYGGGQLMDWIGHHGDIAQWGIGMERSGPIEFDGRGEFPTQGLWNTAVKYEIRAKYANGIDLILADVSKCWGGAKWIGEDGWIHVNRSALNAEPKSILDEKIGPDEIHLYQSSGHHSNFIECVLSRNETVAPAEIGHRSATLGELGNITMQLERKIKWDPKTETIIGDSEATELLSRSYRSPWRL